MTDAAGAAKDDLAQMLATGVVPLAEPVLGDEGPIGELKLRPPKLRDLRGVRFRLSGGGAEIDISDIITVAARLAGQPEAVIGQLGAMDAVRLATMITGFFSPFLTVGKG